MASLSLGLRFTHKRACNVRTGEAGNSQRRGCGWGAATARPVPGFCALAGGNSDRPFPKRRNRLCCCPVSFADPFRILLLLFFWTCKRKVKPPGMSTQTGPVRNLLKTIRIKNDGRKPPEGNPQNSVSYRDKLRERLSKTQNVQKKAREIFHSGT